MRRAVWKSDRGYEIVFNDRNSPFTMNTLDGNDLAGEAETVKPPRSHGQRAVFLTLGTRGIHIEASVLAVGNYSLPAVKVLDQLTERLSEAFAPHVYGLLTYFSEAGARQIRCRPVSLPAFGEKISYYRTVDVDLIADAPFWESVKENVVTVGVLEGYFEWPLEFNDLEMGLYSSTGYIENTHGEAAYPVIEVYTAGSGTTLVNETTGQKIRVDRAIGPGQKMVITTEPSQMSVEVWSKDAAGRFQLTDDVTHWLSLDSLPFWLSPGKNVVKVSNDTPELVPETQIKYRDRFMGVG